MKRVWMRWLPVRKSKIDGDMYSNFTTTEDVVQEGNSVFNLEVLDVDRATLWNLDGVRASTVNHI